MWTRLGMAPGRGRTPLRVGGIAPEEISWGERLAWGVGLSLLLHAALMTVAVVLVPAVLRVAAKQTAATALDPSRVVTFRFPDLVADVAADSRTDEPVATPLLGRFDSKARDRVRDERDTPVPAGGLVADENSIPGERNGRDAGGGADAAQAASRPGSEVAPEGIRPEIADGMPSELVLLTGRPEPPRQGLGARRTPDLGSGGALEFGDYSFSTRAWDYEPYWHNMRARLYAAWRPPAAYTDYGLIQGGWTLVRAVIDRRGHVAGAQVLARDGHESLHRSSYAAMVGAAPFLPLPAQFPDDSLVVTVRFVYMPPDMGRAPEKRRPPGARP